MHRRLAGALTSTTTKWMALVFWVALTAFAVPLSDLTEIESNDAISWLPGSAESTRALEQLASFQDPNQLDAVVIYERQGGLTGNDVAKVDSDVEAFTQFDGVVKQLVTGPLPSADGEALTVRVPLDLGPNGWEKAGAVIADMRETAETDADGLSSYFTGPAGVAADQSEVFKDIDGTLLYSTIAVVVVILLLTYRSPLLWLLPVVSAGIALTCAQAVIYLLAKNADLTVNAQSAGILTVLVFGAGTDYALLLVARYREELRRHDDRHEAMAEALHRAGPAIIASAGTVIVGM
ncbi:MAG: MMPL family transporter, partial [Nocardioidaceae bacterium]|nr:MMPL family transporter [Nocardioidaceae bacterium]